MSKSSRLSRRLFLSNLALIGAAPVWARLDALAWLQAVRSFTGDNFARAHEILQQPGETIARYGPPEIHPELHDVIIAGGGISGLTVAYKLRERDVLLLEAAEETGGVSKSEAWQGIEYAIGAAYIIDPDPESGDERELAGFKLLEELDLRKRDDDLANNPALRRRLSGDANHVVFSNRRVVPEAEVYTARNRRFFMHVLESDDYPYVPPKNASLVEALDRISFRRFLQDAALQKKTYGREAGPISALGWEAIEYYCWGAFGTAADETSAYHALNFFAAEFGDVLVYPGGNAFIAKRLAERVRRRKPDPIRTGEWILRVEKNNQGFAVTTWANGRLHEHRSRAVVFSTPLFLAPMLVPSLPDAQRKAIETFSYRSYVVANILLRRPARRLFAHRAFRDGYELTRVHGIDVGRTAAGDISGRKVFTDAILADFVSPDAAHTVLTVYRPYPYDAGRSQLFGLTYDEMEAEIRREVLAGFGPHGLRASDIDGIRLTRWGHPMLVARPGQMADGTLRAATQSQPGLYFAHTEVNGAPAYENAVAAAFDAVEAVEKWLARV